MRNTGKLKRKELWWQRVIGSYKEKPVYKQHIDSLVCKIQNKISRFYSLFKENANR